ncbi:glycosyltransferase family 2 protein [Candidatus Pacearchaeota archaeon]|nr:glycosyltransferase family 2 protein [Candidatus Pacearchaeota archaeon]
MIDIVITSFKEPRTIGRAIEGFLNQDIKNTYRITVAAPDEETLSVAKKYQKKNKNISIFKDPGKGKSYALNMLIPKLKGEIVVLSDGDVFIKDNSLKYLLEVFKDRQVGCATGRPVSIDDRNTLFGYWSHLLCDAGAHEARLKRAKKKEFLECSGYLWAFRNGVVKDFPLDVAEDTIVPYLFREKGYKIEYTPKAIVYVSFPKNLKDFINQKKRTSKGHETLSKYFDLRTLPRTKSFKNELKESYRAFTYPKTFKEMIYTLALFPIKLYIWTLVFYHTKIKKQHYTDAWERVESTK